MSETTKLQRDSNIELLRLVLMMMVVLLHFNFDTMGGAFILVKGKTIDNFILHFLESLSVCAVNCFMIVSGFFLYTNKQIKFSKILDIILIVIFYNYINYFCKVIFSDESLSLKSVISCTFPANYFAIFYVISYILSPYISKIYRELNYKKVDFLTMIICVLFIGIPTFVDVAKDLNYFKTDPGFLSPISIYGNVCGYTIVQFVVSLSIGMWIRKREIQIKTSILLCIYITSSLLLTIGIYKLPSLYNYCSCLTVVNAMCLFLLFQKIRIQNIFINYAAKSCFAIFCIHVGGFANGLWKQYMITEEHLSYGVFTTLWWTALSVGVMFFGCLLLSIIMRIIFGKVKDLLCKKMPVIYIENE